MMNAKRDYNIQPFHSTFTLLFCHDYGKQVTVLFKILIYFTYSKKPKNREAGFF